MESSIMCIVCVLVGCTGLRWSVSYVKFIVMDKAGWYIGEDLKRVAFGNAVNTVVLFAGALLYYRAPQSVEPYRWVIITFVVSSVLIQMIEAYELGKARALRDIEEYKKQQSAGGGV